MRIAFPLGVLALPSIVAAGPITAGVSLGEVQSKEAADDGAGASRTLGLYGRLALTPRLAGQLELQRLEADTASTDIRTGSALLVLDLGSDRHVVPTLVAGAGLDRASSPFGDTSAHHFEAGIGLEYRSDAGFVVGADARIGDRSVDSDQLKLQPIDTIALYAPLPLRDGEYRALRFTVGVRF